MLFVTVDMDVRAAGLDSGNIWKMPNQDMDITFDNMMKTDIESGDHFSSVFVSCTTLKDPVSFDGKHHTLEVVTYINYEAFKKFENEGKERSEEYLKFKEVLTAKMVNTLEQVLPGVKDHILHKDLGTPITNEYYINSTEGSVYGTEKSLKQIGPFSYQPESEIKDLYLCGASVLSHGVAGAGYSGVQAAAKILECRQEDLINPDESQKLRIYNAEDSSDYPDWMKQKMEVRKKRRITKEGKF
jgi:phytoene dehydrogenase-like protein